MRNDRWNLENEWLNEFSESFVRDTHRFVRNIAIEAEEDWVVVCGRARSYYAVQLAIHCIQTFNRDHSPFQSARLLLDVNGNPIELRFTQRVHHVQDVDASTQMDARRRELTFA